MYPREEIEPPTSLLASVSHTYVNCPNDDCEPNSGCHQCGENREAHEEKTFEILAPSWVGILPVLLVAYESEGEARREARREITRMAQIADLYIATQHGKGK